MFDKVVVANRGAVAARIIRSLKAMGIRSVAVYSEADASAPYLEQADEAYAIGESSPLKSYLNQDALINVIGSSGADGLHPGYGFLAENAEFAKRVEQTGCRFVGPSPGFIASMAHKNHARALMAEHGMPIGAGSSVLDRDEQEILAAARAIGYPVLIKPAGGGGGIGMLPVHEEGKLIKTVERAKALAQRTFSNSDVYLEKYMLRPRHIEYQILADAHGNVRHLYERDCSIQRRHQKIIEESPAPGLPCEQLDELAGTITKVLEKIGYDNIGTVEMLRGEDGSFSFLEMNTRLQVEHAVTEEVTGIDLVASQLRSAAGERLTDILPQHISRNGHAIEARIYAEDPVTFFPSPGKLEVFRLPQMKNIRIETGYAEGREITPYYDPLVAKIISCEDTREQAIESMIAMLEEIEISGIKTNIPFLLSVFRSTTFGEGHVHTGYVEEHQKHQQA